MTVTELYRHYDSDGVLLYIGVSLSAIVRLTGHKSNSPWFNQIASIKIERYPTRVAALEAERLAIENEKPRHNVMGGDAVRKKPGIVRISEAAELLKISKAELRTMVERGTFPLPLALNAQSISWSRVSFENYMRRRELAHTGEPVA